MRGRGKDSLGEILTAKAASLIEDMGRVARELRRYGRSEVIVIHHDEADGICSASIMKKALERDNFNVKALCLEKLFPTVIDRLHSGQGKIFVYTDIGAAHVNRITKVNAGKNLAIILDHHDTERSTDSSVHNLNPELYSISGEREASASTIAYLFAKTMDEANIESAHLAVIGSAEIPGPVSGLNFEPLQDAVKNNLAEVRKTGKTEDIKILAIGKSVSYRRLSTLLSVLGSVGYYNKGPELAISACLKGFSPEIDKIAGDLEEKRKNANQRLLERLRREGLNQMKYTQWFHAEDAYKGMGTKVLGSFCSYLRFQRIVNPSKYLVGFTNMSRELPGFGQLDKDFVKVSSRAPDLLGKMIETGKKPPLSKILPEACAVYGGFGDGHSVAASGILPVGVEEEFMQKLEKLV